MDIQGLQKLTLLDYPGKVACTVFFGGCNLRCPFCHNGELVTGKVPAALDDRELLDFLRRRQGLLDGVCFTGGEPLLCPGLTDLLRAVRELGYSIKLDTNGFRPEKLRELVTAGLVDYVAMDVKNCPSRYAETAGLPSLDLAPFRESLRFLLSGQVDYELRTTVVREFHDGESLEELARWISGARRYFLQPFVDRDTVLSPGLHPYSDAEMKKLLTRVKAVLPVTELRGI